MYNRKRNQAKRRNLENGREKITAAERKWKMPQHHHVHYSVEKLQCMRQAAASNTEEGQKRRPPPLFFPFAP